MGIGAALSLSSSSSNSPKAKLRWESAIAVPPAAGNGVGGGHAKRSSVTIRTAEERSILAKPEFSSPMLEPYFSTSLAEVADVYEDICDMLMPGAGSGSGNKVVGDASNEAVKTKTKIPSWGLGEAPEKSQQVYLPILE